MNDKKPASDEMLMNWPERVWIYSPVRGWFQALHARRWLELTGRPDVSSALEIGCGTGRGARILLDRMGFKRVIAFDLEEKLVTRAAARRRSSDLRRLDFLTADAQDLPFPDGLFDAVVNYGIIHHILDWRRAIREISRVLRPNGLFYFEEIYPPLYANFILKRLVKHPTTDRFDGPQFTDALSNAGLRLVEGVNTHSRFGVIGAARKDPRDTCPLGG